MAKFSKYQPKVKRGTSPLTTSGEATERTFNGAAGYLRSPEGEAFLLASGGFLGGEKTFYEGGDARDERFRFLIRELSATNPDWVANFLSWLRREGNIRTAAIMGAAEYVWARRDEAGTGRTGVTHPTPSKTTREVVRSVLMRPDEPQEIIGYWMARYGRAIPMPIKRGVGDAINHLYHQRNVIKYDSDKRGLRMADVLKLVHPKPVGPAQNMLFDYMMAERFGRVDRFDIKGLTTIEAREDLLRLPVQDRRKVLREQPELLQEAGFTWESIAGWLQGPMDAAAWEAAIPLMGYMALLRNLRNFDKAGISDDAAEKVQFKLTNKAEVARSRQLPFRFWSAYKATQGNLRWSWVAERALTYSLENVPSLDGNTLILVDRSGSMFHSASDHSDVMWSDMAALFGAAIALRAENADLVQFGTHSDRINFSRAESVLGVVDKFTSMGGTNTHAAIAEHLKSAHTRVIIITDEQCSPGYVNAWNDYRYQNQGVSINSLVRSEIPVYMWNFGGYKASMMENAGMENRHCFGGLTDSSFKLIPLIEAGMDAGWPWEFSTPDSGR